MSRTVLVLALGLTVTALATADDKPSLAAKLAAIQKEVADAEAAFQAAQAKQKGSLKADPEVGRLFQAYQEKQKAGLAAALEIAKPNPESKTAFRALEWLLLTPQAYSHPEGRSALRLVAQHHADNPKVGQAVSLVGLFPPYPGEPGRDEVLALLRVVAKKNPDRAARGNAALGLAWAAKKALTLAEMKGAPAAEAEVLAKKAQRAFEVVVKDYGTLPFLYRKPGLPPFTLADQAKPDLDEVSRLRAGKPAPDIEAEDLDGKKFKLSDHRGKVVLLVFWASWCGPCMAEVPHERELVEHFKGRPFVLVGVNGDTKKPDALKAVTKHKITWRSFSNGEEGPGGPIARAWNVRGWPTVYAIDAEGVIRHKYLHGKRLDKPLEDLVAAAEAAAKKEK